MLEALIDTTIKDVVYLWTLVASRGDVELLNCMINPEIDYGLDKDITDKNGHSILWHVVGSGNIEAVRYLLDIGVAIPTYAPEEREVPCKQCKENRLIIDNDSEQEDRDPCLRAIRYNQLEIVKLLDEYGSKSCKSFHALRRAVQIGSVDVVSYLLNKYSYSLNIEYIIKNSRKGVYTLLTEPSNESSAQVSKLLLDHGADPAKQMCAATRVNATMTAIDYKNLEVIAQYIRSGIDINLKSWDSKYGWVLSPFEASHLHDRHYVAEMLLISGCSGGVFSKRKLKNKPKLEKLMKEWNVYENNVIPLKQRCRCVILNHLSPRADLKVEMLPLPGCLIKFLNIPELDGFESKHDTRLRKMKNTFRISRKLSISSILKVIFVNHEHIRLRNVIMHFLKELFVRLRNVIMHFLKELFVRLFCNYS